MFSIHIKYSHQDGNIHWDYRIGSSLKNDLNTWQKKKVWPFTSAAWKLPLNIWLENHHLLWNSILVSDRIAPGSFWNLVLQTLTTWPEVEVHVVEMCKSRLNSRHNNKTNGYGWVHTRNAKCCSKGRENQGMPFKIVQTCIQRNGLYKELKGFNFFLNINSLDSIK